jgi:pimeloyl-ACP methyl ester carboxylesterase
MQVTTASALTPLSVKTEEFTIPGADPGIALYLRNKHALGDRFRGTVLFVHGETYPGESLDVVFDAAGCPSTKPLSFDDLLRNMDTEDFNGTKWRSWLDYHALSGFDVYFVDVRGYGRSTKPREMNEPADKNQPVVRTDIAARDLAVAVDFILKRRNIGRLDLIGSAWGSVLAAGYAAQHPERVERLVLQSPIWLRDAPVVQVPWSLPAYRVVTREEARQRWFDGVPKEKRADLIPCGWFDRWADRIWATDPEGGTQSPPIVRVPNGALLDDQVYWSASSSLYNPSSIAAPVLLIRGEWDRESTKHMVQNLFGLLVNARYKHSVVIPEATHLLMVEKSRLQLFREVEQFLEQSDEPPAVSWTPKMRQLAKVDPCP